MTKEEANVSPFFALVCFMLAAGLAGGVAVWGIRKAVTGSPVRQAAAYDRLWFSDTDVLIGMRRDERALTVDAWKQGGDVARRDVIELPESAGEWYVGPSGKRAAWVDGGRLYCRELFAEAAETRSLRLPPAASIAGFLMTGSGPAIVNRDATLDVWDCGESGKLQRRDCGLLGADLFLSAGRYIAFVSTEKAEAVVMQAPADQPWTLVGRAKAKPPARLAAMSVGGRVAMLGENSVTVSKIESSTPGKVQAVAMGYQGRVFATGDFDGVFHLDPAAQPEQVAAAPEGTKVLAVGRELLAFSTDDGATILRLEEISRLTPTGEWMAIASGVFLLAALLILVSGFLGELLRKMIEFRLRGKRIDRSLPRLPPEELVRALRQNQCILWAGAGLSAQAGFPVWTEFARGLVEWGVSTELLDERSAGKLRQSCAGGGGNQVIDSVVNELAEYRDEVAEHYRRVFLRPAAVSSVHRRLASIPFVGALTTNYDLLLESTGAQWALNMATTVGRDFETVIRRGGFFLLKLYGDFEVTRSVRLTQGEFAAAVGGNTVLSDLMHEMLDARTLCFIGASLDGIDHDLSRLGIQRKPSRKHFALLAVENEDFQPQVKQMEQKYGIEVLPFSLHKAEAELSGFLERLAKAATGQERQREGQAVSAQV